MPTVCLHQLLSNQSPSGLHIQARQHQCQNILLQIPQERLLKHKTIPARSLVSQLEQQMCLRKLSPSRDKSHQGEIAHGLNSTSLTLPRLEGQGLGTQGN